MAEAALQKGLLTQETVNQEGGLADQQRLQSCPLCGSSDTPEGETYCRVCGTSLERK